MRSARVIVSGVVTLGLLIIGAITGAAQNVSVVVGHQASLADGGALSFELDDGSLLRIQLSDGHIHINGNMIGSYDREGTVERSWLQLVRQAVALSSAELLQAARAWQDEELATVESETVEALSTALAGVEFASEDLEAVVRAAVAAQSARDSTRIYRLSETGSLSELATSLATLQQSRATAARDFTRLQRESALSQLEDLQLDINDAQVHIGDLRVEQGEVVEGSLLLLKGDAAILGRVAGNIVSFDGNIRLFPGARVDGDVIAVNGTVIGAHSLVRGDVRVITSARAVPPIPPLPQRIRPTRERVSVVGEIGRSTATFLGTLVALACIGFGVTFYAPNQLEAVAARVAENPGRSFLAGLFAQPLILPVIAMLVVGLTISLVGIVLVPFAIIALALAVVASAVVGYLAVARNVGGRYLRQKSANHGTAVNIAPYRALVCGLVFMLGVWLPAVLLSWVPVAGTAVLVTAVVFTWMMATAGFGAVITTRAGTGESLFGPRFRAARLTGHK